MTAATQLIVPLGASAVENYRVEAVVNAASYARVVVTELTTSTPAAFDASHVETPFGSVVFLPSSGGVPTSPTFVRVSETGITSNEKTLVSPYTFPFFGSSNPRHAYYDGNVYTALQAPDPTLTVDFIYVLKSGTDYVNGWVVAIGDAGSFSNSVNIAGLHVDATGIYVGVAQELLSAGPSNYATIKLDFSGNVVWKKGVHAGYTSGYTERTMCGSPGGVAYYTGCNSARVLFYALGADGTLLFNKQGSSLSINIECMVGLDSGGLMLGYLPDEPDDEPAFALRFDAAGDVVWCKRFLFAPDGVPSNWYCYAYGQPSCAAGPDGFFFVFGASGNYSAAVLCALDLNGDLLFSRQIRAVDPNWYIEPYSVTLDGLDVVVTLIAQDSEGANSRYLMRVPQDGSGAATFDNTFVYEDAGVAAADYAYSFSVNTDTFGTATTPVAAPAATAFAATSTITASNLAPPASTLYMMARGVRAESSYTLEELDAAATATLALSGSSYDVSISGDNAFTVDAPFPARATVSLQVQGTLASVFVNSTLVAQKTDISNTVPGEIGIGIETADPALLVVDMVRGRYDLLTTPSTPIAPPAPPPPPPPPPTPPPPPPAPPPPPPAPPPPPPAPPPPAPPPPPPVLPQRVFTITSLYPSGITFRPGQTYNTRMFDIVASGSADVVGMYLRSDGGHSAITGGNVPLGMFASLSWVNGATTGSVRLIGTPPASGYRTSLQNFFIEIYYRSSSFSSQIFVVRGPTIPVSVQP